MKEISSGHFYGRLHNKKRHSPLNGQIELTYLCNLKCIHCYCRGSEDKDRELNTRQWKKIFDEIQKEGCIYLTFTGGDPLIRDDFLELYSYAKKNGFIITIFTNGLALNRKIIDYLAKSPPYAIEITLNGITPQTYEAITQVKDSFSKVLENIKKIKQRNLRLILKSNCLKQNKHEIAKIKAFVDKFLGKEKGKYYFKYDPMIFVRLNRDKTPCDFRLSFEEMSEVRKQDVDIWEEYQKGLHTDSSDLQRNGNFLYHCNSWMTHFFITPYGQLRFCLWSDKFSVNLKTTAFKQGFYKVFPTLLNEKFKTTSKCQNCRLRPICYYCPTRAYLETGDEEAPVPYFCELAKMTNAEMRLAKKTS